MNRKKHTKLLIQEVLTLEKFGYDKLTDECFERFKNFLDTCSDSILFKFEPDNLLITDRSTIELDIRSEENQTILHIEIGDKDMVGFYKQHLLDLDVESIKSITNLLIV